MTKVDQIEANANLDAAIADIVAVKRFNQMMETPAERESREQAEHVFNEAMVLESMHLARETKRAMAALKNAAKTK